VVAAFTQMQKLQKVLWAKFEQSLMGKAKNEQR
jgi:hypothetical protein